MRPTSWRPLQQGSELFVSAAELEEDRAIHRVRRAGPHAANTNQQL